MNREQSLERSLPYSAEAETTSLGLIILDNRLMPEAIELLRPEDYYVPSNRRIYTVMIVLFEKGSPIEPGLIGEELKKENALESVGGISYITNLTYGLPHATTIKYYAKVIRGKSYLRQLVRAANKITLEALEEEDDPEVIGDHAEKLIYDLRDERTEGSKFIHFKPVAEAILEKIQDQEGRATGALTGLTTGFADLDRLTSGFQDQDLIIVAARPGMGKTSSSTMLAMNAAIHAGIAVAFFSLEMSTEALVMRMLCQHANIDFQRFRNGFMSRAEWSQIAKSLGVLADTKIFFDDTPGITPMEMRAKHRRLETDHKVKIRLTIVDYLQKMKGSKKRYESRHLEVGDIANDLKNFAKETDSPVVALAQLSRAPENRTAGEHRPQLSDLRDSGRIEEEADTVAFLYRPEVYMTYQQREDLPDDEKCLIEVIVAKQRNGPTDTVRLRWTASSMRLDNLYRENQGQMTY